MKDIYKPFRISPSSLSMFNKCSMQFKWAVIDEIEALLDTWTREQHEDLFKILSGLGGRMNSPVLIVTRLNLSYEDFMSKDRIFRTS